MKTFRLPVFLLAMFMLMEFGSLQTRAQSRTSGNSRSSGNARPVTPTPAPVSEGSRDIGRTRESSEAFNPVSNGSRDNGRTNPELPPPVSTTADIAPPPTHGLNQRPPVHDHVILVDGDVGRTSRADGLWIRDDVRYGRSVTLAGNISMPEYSGYDFSEQMKRSFDDQFTDMFVEEDAEGLMMSVREDTEIMDIGAVNIPEYAIYAPRMEWSPLHRVPLIPGHEYVILTWDDHYAKFVVTSLVRNRVVFNWAYQYGTDDNFQASAVRSPKGDKFQR